MTVRAGVVRAQRWMGNGTHLVIAARVLVCLAFTTSPDRCMRGLFGVPAAGRPARLVAAHYAVRDLTLGLALSRALRRSRQERFWMLAGTAADALDCVAIAATSGRKSRSHQRLLLAQMGMVLLADTVITLALDARRPQVHG